MQHLLIRTDANTEIGVGHFMRCLAIAQAWQDAGGRVAFLTATASEELINLLKAEKITKKDMTALMGSGDDVRQTAMAAREMAAAWIVVDGYQFDGEYQKRLKETGCRILWVDDSASSEHYYADLVLNQNLYAHEAAYVNREPYTQLLLGAPYVLLRRQFDKWKNRQRNIPDLAARILVTMGGGDANNVTFKMLCALEELSAYGLEVKIVVGATNPHVKCLQEIIESSSSHIQLFKAVTDISRLMNWADLAIGASGTTNLEFAYMGLPSCCMILADNQEAAAKKFQALGISINLGWFDDVDPPEASLEIRKVILDRRLRESMSLKGRALIQGSGSRNVVGAMLERSNE